MTAGACHHPFADCHNVSHRHCSACAGCLSSDPNHFVPEPARAEEDICYCGLAWFHSPSAHQPPAAPPQAGMCETADTSAQLPTSAHTAPQGGAGGEDDCPVCDVDLDMLCDEHSGECDCGAPLEAVRPGKYQCPLSEREHGAIITGRLHQENASLREQIEKADTDAAQLRATLEGANTSIDMMSEQVAALTDYAIKLQRLIESLYYGRPLPEEAKGLHHYAMAEAIAARQATPPEPPIAELRHAKGE